MTREEWTEIIKRLGLGDLPWASYSGPDEPVINVTMKASDWRALLALAVYANEQKVVEGLANVTEEDDASDMTTPRHAIPQWLSDATEEHPFIVQSRETFAVVVKAQDEPVAVRSDHKVALVMSTHDYNALVLLLGVAAASGHNFMETALRLMRAFNPPPPEAAP